MNERRRRRQERAADRIARALADREHEWRRHDGPEKAHTCLQNLMGKGVYPTPENAR